MNYKNYRFLIPALGAAVLLSCQVDELVPADLDHGDEISPVTVSLQLTQGSELNGTPQTRAIDDPADKDDTQIHNLCILQYSGTGDDASLVGDVHYLRSDVDPEDENYLDLRAIKLADSWGAQHTLVILTNTFTQLGGDQIKTLGGMLSLWRTVGGEPDVFGHTGQGEAFPNDTDYYQRMNALVVSVIANDATIKGTLHRSMARINVVIDNDGSDGLQIHQVQLRNVSMKDYYVTDYSYLDENDDVQLLRDTPFQDEYVPSDPRRADYAARTWSDGGGTNNGSVQSGAGTGTAAFRWYVPSNMRGTSDNTLPSEKNMSSNVSGATYLWILASYGVGHDESILYKFYLGENLVNDFNLKPNASYTYRLTFHGKGNTVTDKRVVDYGAVNFTLDANCYIVNPPVEGSRKYTFNVVHRPNIFWGGPSSGDRYGFYNNSQGEYPANFIGTTEPWHARILWSDVAYDMNALLTRNTGTGGGAGYMDDTQRVELTIPSDITEGNIVIGVWTGDDPNVILWSWHIWITNYRPDDIVGHAPDGGVFLYNVEGGEVHRYRGGNWEGTSARYKEGYVMDRYLGALDQKYRTARGGGFYYQSGRKDPFPGAYTVYTYTEEGTRTQVNSDAVPKVSSSGTGQNGKNVPWSVNNPRTFITGNTWTSDDIFNGAYNWADPYSTQRMENEETGKNASKSFFDPCPPGWRIPNEGFMSHFNGDAAGSSTSSTAVNFQWDVESFNGHGRGTGRTYYPLTFAASKAAPADAPTAFFPALGARNNGGTVGTGVGWIWYVNHNTIQSRCGLFSSGQIVMGNAHYNAMGFPVRCIRESYQ